MRLSDLKIKELDKRGVRAFVTYAQETGNWAIEVYRKKRPDETTGDTDWKMIRIGHIQTYSSREEAFLKSIELAEQVAKENNF